MGYQFTDEDEAYFTDLLANTQYVEDAGVDLTKPADDDDDSDDPDSTLDSLAELARNTPPSDPRFQVILTQARAEIARLKAAPGANVERLTEADELLERWQIITWDREFDMAADVITSPPDASIKSDPAPDQPQLPERWHGVIGVEGELTGDGRFVDKGALRWEDLPLPLRFVSADMGAHSGAVVVGRIQTIERDEESGEIRATGDFDLGSEAGREAARVIDKQVMNGVSMDLDDVAFEVRVAADAIETLEALAAQDGTPDADGRVTREVSSPDDEVMVTQSARVRAATIVAVPAFARAKIRSLTASGAPDPWANTYNWVDDVGGLPEYIKRIEKHLEKKGMAKGHAIAVAVNAVKKMCATGDLNFPGKQDVNPGSKAEACKAVAEWEEKKARAKADSNLSDPSEKFSERKGIGGYPISDCADLQNAIQAVGRARPADRAATIAHIKSAKKELGCKEVSLPEKWANMSITTTTSTSNASSGYVTVTKPGQRPRRVRSLRASGSFNEGQMRVPKGNGRRSGRWVDMPGTSMDSLFGDVDAFEKEGYDLPENVQNSLDDAFDAVQDLRDTGDRPDDPHYSKDLGKVIGFLEEAQEEIGREGLDSPVHHLDDAVGRTIKSLHDFDSIDMSLLPEANDVGSEGTDLRGPGGSDLTTPESTDLGRLSPEDFDAALRAAQEELEGAIQDAIGDNPDVNPDDIHHDMVQSIATMIDDPQVRKEFLRGEGVGLGGFDPLAELESDDLDLPRRPVRPPTQNEPAGIVSRPAPASPEAARAEILEWEEAGITDGVRVVLPNGLEGTLLMYPDHGPLVHTDDGRVLAPEMADVRVTGPGTGWGTFGEPAGGGLRGAQPAPGIGTDAAGNPAPPGIDLTPRGAQEVERAQAEVQAATQAYDDAVTRVRARGGDRSEYEDQRRRLLDAQARLQAAKDAAPGYWDDDVWVEDVGLPETYFKGQAWKSQHEEELVDLLGEDAFLSLPNDLADLRQALIQMDVGFGSGTALDRLIEQLGEVYTVKGQAMTAAAPPKDPDLPPAAFFNDPHLKEPTALTITPEGRIYGHLATWAECHLSHSAHGQCVTAPRSRQGYAYFNTGSILTKEGAEIPCGRITMNTGHAKGDLRAAATLAHYDNTGTVVADVVAGEDAHGIWFAGALRPGLAPKDVRALRMSPLSGDWRRMAGNLELVAALAVNVGGFPVVRKIPRPAGLVASGSMQSLVAAGMLPPRTVQRPGTRGALSADDLHYLKTLIAREKRDEDERKMATLDAAAQLAARLRTTAVLDRARRIAERARRA